MGAEPQRILALAQAVADGTPVDWAEEESSSPAAERTLVRELRLLAGVAGAHRSIGEESDVPTDVQKWGVLIIREKLGSGTFGSVYRAWDPRLGRDVALKLLHRPASPTSPSSVIEEARLMARLRNTHVVTVYGADDIDGRVGIWMEFIRGRTLSQVVQQDGPFSAREATSIGLELCGALAAVHHARILHRDIKAQNVMREQGGRLVLMDFGAGQEVKTDVPRPVLSGTPVYMAPEVLRGGSPSRRSDLFSLGVLLFHIVTGEYPVPGRTPDQVRAAHDRGERRRLADVRPDLPHDFVRIVERALAPNPDDRFDSAGAMQAALAARVETMPEEQRTVPVPGPRISRRTWIAGAAAAAIVAAAIAVPTWLWFSSKPAAPKTIAVLPFEDPTGAEDEYFASGVTEILMSRLALVPPLRVIARASIAALPPGDRAAATLRRRLHADYAIEGSVQRQNQRVRLTARVLEAGTGTIIWAQTYERPVSDLFAMQSELASSIAANVGATLSGDAQRRVFRRETASVEAQDAYLRGRYLIYTFNSSNFATARDEFRRAIALDPEYALAHASLARTYGLMLDFDIGRPAELEPLAIREASLAVQLNPDLVETNVAHADAQFRYAHDWAAAESAYRRALTIAPYSSVVLTPYVRFLCAAGRLDDALAEARVGVDSDPLSAEMLGTVGMTHYYRREFDEALRWFTRVTEVAPTNGPAYFGMARAHTEKHDYDAAVAAIRKALSLVGENASYDAELARVYALHGWNELAGQTLGGLLVRTGDGHHVPYEGIAYAYIAMGKHDEGFEWLGRAEDEYFARLLFVKVDPRADPIRTDPRYAAILRRLGLP